VSLPEARRLKMNNRQKVKKVQKIARRMANNIDVELRGRISEESIWHIHREIRAMLEVIGK